MPDTTPAGAPAAGETPRTALEGTLRIAAIALLVAGCFLVLRPFLAAMLFAAVLCLTTWPFFKRLRKLVRGRGSLAAGLMIVLLLAIVILPLALAAGSFAADAARMVDAARSYLEEGLPPPPAWVARIPLAGESLDAQWRAVAADRAQFAALARSLMNPAREVLIALGGIMVQGVFQMCLVAFAGFFFYRDGEAMIALLRAGTGRVAERLSGDLLATVHGTVTSVVHGILGTAAVQALLAFLGLVIAGVPAAFALAAATFFLSLVPAGPPLVWGGAAVWLYCQSGLGWAIFMALWGAVLVSGSDNVLKPLLISRGGGLSLLMVALGVLGGMLAFGFVGIFIGPVLLAVLTSVLRFWLVRKDPGAATPSA
ncbi:MAG TPA: AI-2E family transporter [Planctomycetota bacterium]|jgi:predicted PurR-regulated permease PerM|nr:AI-2E family transporter [Planctomycetota bacterium]OQC21646.1 MAG: putative inner membrane protein [Planctomycetes bacterium ADurb.Bin069]HNS00392.1 AI-2E family transporter [Planctomycetota bacterium]HNU26182.1 AI-2E family transporter [Planctomycetota bacterium]HOE28712.1 AI-2E family transporter [Planctomycetota bacterium]